MSLDLSRFLADAEKAVTALEQAGAQAEQDVAEEMRRLAGSQTQLAQSIVIDDNGIKVNAAYGIYVEEGSPAVEDRLMVWQGPSGPVFSRSRRAIPAHPFFRPGAERFHDFVLKRMEALS